MDGVSKKAWRDQGVLVSEDTNCRTVKWWPAEQGPPSIPVTRAQEMRATGYD